MLHPLNQLQRLEDQSARGRNSHLDSKAVTTTCTLVSYAIVPRGLSGVLGKDCVMSQKNSGCGLLKDECYVFSLAIMSMNQGFSKALSGHSR